MECQHWYGIKAKYHVSLEKMIILWKLNGIMILKGLTMVKNKSIFAQIKAGPKEHALSLNMNGIQSICIQLDYKIEKIGW